MALFSDRLCTNDGIGGFRQFQAYVALNPTTFYEVGKGQVIKGSRAGQIEKYIATLPMAICEVDLFNNFNMVLFL